MPRPRLFADRADPGKRRRTLMGWIAGAPAPRAYLGGLRNVLAPFDPSHQPLELVRSLGAEIGVVHSTKLFGNGKQGLGSQADNLFLCVLLGDGHVGSTFLGTHHQTVCRKPLTRRGTEGSSCELAPARGCPAGLNA